jgi:tetratricopeptide (TPR) repeat protein
MSPMPMKTGRQLAVAILVSLLFTSEHPRVVLLAREEKTSAIPVIPPLVVDKDSVSGPPSGGQTVTEEERFLIGLRRRGLLDFAEKYCRQLLERGDLDSQRHTRVVTQLALVFVDRARLSPAAERPSLLQRADTILEEAASQVKEPTLRLVLIFERARIWSASGQMLLEEAEQLGYGEAQRVACRDHLRKALDSLRQLDPQVQELMRMEGSGTEDPSLKTSGLSVFQLAELLKAIRFEWGLCALALARSFPPESPDRSAYAAEAVSFFAELATLPVSHRLAWPSRILQVQALREGKNFPEWEKQLLHWEKSNPPKPEGLRLRAERLRLLLAKKDLQGALSTLQVSSEEDFANSAELSLAAIEVLLAATQKTGEGSSEKDRADLQARLHAITALVQSYHDAVTLRKVRSLLAREMPAAGREDPETWALAGQHAFHAGEYRQAVQAYDKAVMLGVKSLPQERIWQFALMAANITALEKNHLEACLRYRSLALWQPRHSQASEVHLLAIQQAGLLAQGLSKSSGSGTGHLASAPGDLASARKGSEQVGEILPKSESPVSSSGSPVFGNPLGQNISLPGPLPSTPAEAYTFLRELGREHLQYWPEGNSADTVRILLGRLLWEQGQHTGAVEVLGRISPGSSRFPQAVEELERYLSPIGLHTARKPGAEVFAAAEKVLESWLTLTPTDEKPSLLEFWARSSLLAATVHLAKGPPATSRAEAILGRVIPWADKLPQALQVALQAKLLKVYMLEGRVSEALPLGRQMARQAPAELYLVCEEIWANLSAHSWDPRSLQAECLRGVLEEMRQQDLQKELEDKVTRIWLEFSWQSGKSAEALAEARSWVAEAPSDPERRLLWARLLLCEVFRAGEPQSTPTEGSTVKNALIEEARQLWRQVEASAATRCPAWYEAKAALALLALRVGDQLQAERIVRLVQLMHPGQCWLDHPAVIRLLTPLPPSAGLSLRKLLGN